MDYKDTLYYKTYLYIPAFSLSIFLQYYFDCQHFDVTSILSEYDSRSLEISKQKHKTITVRIMLRILFCGNSFCDNSRDRDNRN